MSLMPPPKNRFLDAAKGRSWKSAYDECNGLNMVDMLDCMQELGVDLVNEMRDQMEKYTIWGGPNMERIRFAMDVAEFRKIPVPSPGPPVLWPDQLQNARDFLARPAQNPETLELTRAYDEGRVFFDKGYENAERLFLMAIHHDKLEGLPVEHSPQLERALVKLASLGRVQIMRTFAPRERFHGVRESKRWVGSCADVMAYGGNIYEWHTPKAALIDGVAKLIRDLPVDAKYDFGFVRPVGGQGNSKPEADVFFEVRTPKQIDDAWAGNQRPLSEMLPDARAVVEPALTTKSWGFLYADGSNHVHMRAYAG